MKLLQGMTLILIMSIGIFFLSSYIKSKERHRELPVSLPEELPLVKKGDTLYVTEVTDSIYIGFRK